MRYKLLVLIISMAVIITTFPARAGKPRPPDPYPQPDMQAEAYPAPGQGAPGVQDFNPLAPTWPDPRPGVPYFWGIFPDSTGYWRGYVTIDLGYPDFDYVGVMCLMSNNTGDVICYQLYPHNYVSGRMTYMTTMFLECGYWSGWATLDGIMADIRQPNEYLIKCIFIPQIKRG